MWSDWNRRVLLEMCKSVQLLWKMQGRIWPSGCTPRDICLCTFYFYVNIFFCSTGDGTLDKHSPLSYTTMPGYVCVSLCHVNLAKLKVRFPEFPSRCGSLLGLATGDTSCCHGRCRATPALTGSPASEQPRENSACTKPCTKMLTEACLYQPQTLIHWNATQE